jgi:radical SAM superfamily enzyme YgiQ (UPF0313 family)
MKILFLNPPFKGRFSRSSRSPAVAKGGTLYYPIWLAYAAGVAESKGHDVSLIDAPAEGTNRETVFERINKFAPDLVVVDSSTPSIYNDVAIVGEIKEQVPGASTVLVGTHPSALPDETLSLDNRLDAVAMAEYDYTISDLAFTIERDMTLEQVDGLVFRRNGKIVHNKMREKINDLDRLPFVSSVYKRHLNAKNYFFAAARYPMIMIMSGRGCPFKCFFCVYPQVLHGRRYRARSPENVVEEIYYIKKNLQEVKEIGFEDDCFTADKKRVAKICELMIKRKIKFEGYCNVRGDLDYPLLKLMKMAGCRLVTVGFESGCQHILDNIQKGETVDKYFQFAKDARKAGILVHGCIMVGNPGDNEETVRESYEFAKKINCDSMQFYPLYVYPGTDAFNWAKERKCLKTHDYSQWLTEEGLHNCVLNTSEMTSEDMVNLCDHYLKKYHFRYAYLFRKACQAGLHPLEGLRSLKSARVLISKLLAGQLGKVKPAS